MKLENIVPFGRSLDEYSRMFRLTREDRSRNVLGVADGPASFNAEWTAQGGSVVSVDPIYAFEAGEIRNRFDAVVDDIIEQVENSPDNWVWSYHENPEGLRRHRIEVIERFTEDFLSARGTGRYIVGSLPNLPFPAARFDLALCSHFLFLYSDHLSYEFHERSVKEMLRVAGEVRIFPLLTLSLDPSPHLPRLLESLAGSGYSASVQRVDYELQKGGNAMLVVRA